jgi:hypothetical protein
MKVVCILSNKPHIIKVLTPYKIYEVLEEFGDNYVIIDDRNIEGIYQKYRFISLDLHRENLIEEIIK